jgi:uncharacterized protein YbjT (DUF2867 family)
MNVAILGASGFLGKQLSQAILKHTDWNLYAVARRKQKLRSIGSPSDRLTHIEADVLSASDLRQALKNIDIVYYFIHFMGHNDKDFYEAELRAAHLYAHVAKEARIARTIYMGGLGDNQDSSSKHLHSRHRTGEILRAELDDVIELRASMIIGDGSVGYDIIRSVVHKLPLLLLPKSADTLTQPIALEDALRYLLASATINHPGTTSIDIGGPDILSYADIYRLYAKFVHKRTLLIKIPFVPTYAAGKFLDLVTPHIHARIGSIMAESMSTKMVVTDSTASELFPSIKPVPIHTAFVHAKRTI